MLRPDLEGAGSPTSTLAVWCSTSTPCVASATLADQAGVTPRVVQRLMRHSTLELTGRYTRPRAVDIEKAAESLPSLRLDADRPNASTLAATGTDGQP